MRVRSSQSASVVYEHPYIVRLCHWLTAIALSIMTGSGIEIFRAFPSFGAKIPERDVVNVPSWFGFGGWLGGALQLHFTFMWIFAGTGLLYVVYQITSRNYRQVLFAPSDVPGIWPMLRHYFLFGPKPQINQSYNSLQKLAYTTAICLGGVSLVTGIALYKPVQFAGLVRFLGGFRWVRLEHFLAMLGFLSFIPCHLIMVAIHGWSHFASMISGWQLRQQD